MESNIKIKATGKEINDLFNANRETYYVKYYKAINIPDGATEEQIDNNIWIYDVLIRHNEAPKKLDRKQPYTIQSMEETLTKLLSKGEI